MPAKSDKRSRRRGAEEPDAVFRGVHPPDCDCEQCQQEREEAAAIKKRSEERKKGMVREDRRRRFMLFFPLLRTRIIDFWDGMRDVIGATLSFVTVTSIVLILLIMIRDLNKGQWIVPLVCIGALLAVSYVNERIG